VLRRLIYDIDGQDIRFKIMLILDLVGRMAIDGLLWCQTRVDVAGLGRGCWLKMVLPTLVIGMVRHHCLPSSARGFGGGGMVVDMRLLGVVPFLILLAVVVAVGEFNMIVRMRVPVHAVLHLARLGDMMGDVPMIVAVGYGRMGVLGLATFALGMLLSHGDGSFPVGRRKVLRLAPTPAECMEAGKR
jgi:hypothetical protein